MIRMDTYQARAEQKLHSALPANPRAAIRPAEAVLILVFLALLVAWLDSGNLAAQIVEEKHDRIMEQRGCIAQYAAGERYAKKKPQQCAPMVEAPNHILAIPVGQ